MAIFTVTTLNDAGAGSFRAAWEAALTRADQEDPATIVFSVGGAITISSTFLRASSTSKNITVDGTTAPTLVTLDCSTTPQDDNFNERPILDISSPNVTLKHFDALNPPYALFRFINPSATNGQAKFINIVNNDGRGNEGGAFSASNGVFGTLFEDCTVTGASRLRGFMVSSKEAGPFSLGIVLRRCTAFLVRGGFDIVVGSTAILENCHADACLDYGLQADRFAVVDATDTMFENLAGPGVGVRVFGSRCNLVRCTVQHSSGSGPRNGIILGNVVLKGIEYQGQLKVEDSKILHNTADGVRVFPAIGPNAPDPICDLGGGSLGSVGRNTIQGNGLKGVQNNTSVTVKAENNTWDHSLVTDVQTLDVSANVDVAPLFTGGGEPATAATFQINAVDDEAFQISAEARRAEVTWSEFEVPSLPSGSGQPAFQIDAVDDAAFQTSSGIGILGAAFQVNAVEDTAFQIPDPGREAAVSWAEVEVPDAGRRAEVAWAECEVPNTPIPPAGGEILVPTDTLTLEMAYSLMREIVAPTLSQRLGGGAMQRRRLYERPVYAFRVQAIEMTKLEQENFYSFAAFHQGDIPFWFGGGEWGTITNPILVGFGNGTQTQFFLPNRTILTGPTVKVNGIATAVTLTASSGLITFVNPPATDAKITATYTCRYKVVFGDADEVLLSEELFAFQLFNDQGIKLVEMVP